MRDLKAPVKKFRPEIEGVRVVAAILVAVYHIWLGKVSGGVDVFFIVSGFLITTSLLSKIERDGYIKIFAYLLGLLKRLIPLAFTVLFVTSLLSIFIMPKVQWEQIISEVIASSFYFENWELAFNAVDYLEQSNEASPLQHFWALSLQGQFYLLWPLIITFSFFLARKVFKFPPRLMLLTVFAQLFIISISYSIYKTAVNQPWAYFDTLARMWEFSLGGMVALLISAISFNKTVSGIIGWVGLAIICFTGILLPVSTVFPGYAALLPTTGVIFILLAAQNGPRLGVEKLLGAKPFVYLGSFSYGIYLWHWPLLIFYLTYFKVETVSLTAGVTILVVAFILSFITTKVLEAPVRKLNIREMKGKFVAAVSAFIIPVLAVILLWNMQLKDDRQQIFHASDYPGAQALAIAETINTAIEPIPSMLEVKYDLPEFYEDPNCVTRSGGTLSKCSFGVIDNPAYTVALVGGSHSGHWFPAIMEFADELKLKVDVYNHDACKFASGDFDGIFTESCIEWNRLMMEELIQNPPDLVFTTASISNEDHVPKQYVEHWQTLKGITNVFAIRDNPQMKENIPLCLAREQDYIKCSIERKNALSKVQPWENTKGIPSNVYFADLSDYFCDQNMCYSVIGNIIVYRDAHHITAEYAKTLAPFLKEHIVKALKWIS